MDKLVAVQADYLLEQAKVGTAGLQVFDSWVGLAVGVEAYKRFVAPYNAKLLGCSKKPGYH